jgi:hypothetical protein
MKYFAKTNNKPHFPYMSISFAFLIGFLCFFWSIGVEGNVVMDVFFGGGIQNLQN